MTGERRITISEQQAWRIYLLLEEMNDFLHQSKNYRSVEELDRWLEKKGVYSELRDVFYLVVGPWFPIDEETGAVIGPGGKPRL
jgi:hypothetical protein